MSSGTDFDEIGKSLRKYHTSLEATGQLNDDVRTTCPKSPTGEHKWKLDDEYWTEFCKYCGVAKFHEQLNVLAEKHKSEKEKKKQRCIEASMSPRPKGIIFKRCPTCNKILWKTVDCIRCGDTHFTSAGLPISYTLGLYCYYYTCSKCGYEWGWLVEK